MVALLGAWFTYDQNQQRQYVEDQRAGHEQTLEDKRAENQQAAETQRANNQLHADDQRTQDTAVQDFLKEMGDLLLKEDIHHEDPSTSYLRTDEVSRLLRVRTIILLGRIDPERKRSIMQFLVEQDLIKKDDPFVSLTTADLHGADLNGFPLYETYLRATVLKDAHLNDANLRGADLRGVDLSDGDDADEVGADLTDADLTDANLNGDNLTNARVSDEQIASARSREGTTRPNGRTINQ